MIPHYYEFKSDVKILSGINAIEHVPFELNQLGAIKPLILTNDILIELGLVKYVTKALKEAGMSVDNIYTKIPPDSSVKVVNEIAEVYRRNQCDSIIAIGGGSVIDTAKGVNIVISEDVSDIMDVMGSEILSKKQKPFIVIPTTSGTGSEATLVAVIANPDKHVKMEFLSYHLLPDVAVLDPRMTMSLPAQMTASTGMDALVHAIEAFTSIQKNPLSDAYAFASIQLIRDNLLKSIENQKETSIRLALANASLMAGIAFSNSMVGVIHAIGHAIGGVSHVPHGDAMAILLPYGMEYNRDVVDKYYSELLLPLAGPDVYASTEEEQRSEKSIETVKSLLLSLNQKAGLPIRLQDVGVKKEDFHQIAKTALNDGAIIANPKEVELEDIIKILDKAF